MGVVANNNYYCPWAFVNNPEIPGRIPFGVLLHRVSKNNRKCRSSWNAGTEGKPKGPFVYFPLRGVYMNQQPHNHFKPLFKRQILQPYLIPLASTSLKWSWGTRTYILISSPDYSWYTHGLGSFIYLRSSQP